MGAFSRIVGTMIAVAWMLALLAVAVLWFAPIDGGREFLAAGWGRALLVFGVGPLIVGLIVVGTGLVVSMIEDEGWRATFVMMAVLVGGGFLLWGISTVTLETQGWAPLLLWLAGRVALAMGGLMVVCLPAGASIALVRSWRRRRASI